MEMLKLVTETKSSNGRGKIHENCIINLSRCIFISSMFLELISIHDIFRMAFHSFIFRIVLSCGFHLCWRCRKRKLNQQELLLYTHTHTNECYAALYWILSTVINYFLLRNRTSFSLCLLSTLMLLPSLPSWWFKPLSSSC